MEAGCIAALTLRQLSHDASLVIIQPMAPVEEYIARPLHQLLHNASSVIIQPMAAVVEDIATLLHQLS